MEKMKKVTMKQILNVGWKAGVEGTAATCAFGVQKGCHMMRVHDVKEVARTVKMIDALVGKFTVEGELAPRH